MKRKFVTEYAYGYMNSLMFMTPAHQLLGDNKVSPAQEEQLAKCNIYIISMRPTPYFDPDTLKHANNIFSGTLCYKVNGQERRVEFNNYQWKIEKGSTIECPYPHREVICRLPNGTIGELYLPANLLVLKCNYGGDMLNDYEVLYVGQAIGNKANRSAFDRLKSHSTFQKILAITAQEYPDNEIMIFMFEFENGQMFSSTDGMAKEANNTPENEERLVNAIRNPPDKKQKIGLIEAGLIRYFEPKYNEIFKINFPSVKQKVLLSCKNLDVTGLIVELDSSDLRCRLFSPSVTATEHHIAQFDLVSQEKRMSFFNTTRFNSLPNVISGS
ncbi:hypothetical protein [Shewanella sp. SM96]|uniref:hypothetical protein n=1 Tax=Shewanella sp. SM96 TaxID=2912813 RepID=UPI0021DAA235|nr:hypothetical protein [Shewanella sp. SM96]MCU8004389.1 hypothetical protein [Shewanella sp. SM96]